MQATAIRPDWALVTKISPSRRVRATEAYLYGNACTDTPLLHGHVALRETDLRWLDARLVVMLGARRIRTGPAQRDAQGPEGTRGKWNTCRPVSCTTNVL